MFTDKEIVCCQCNQPFIFSAGEQEYFAGRSLSHEPKRCQNCRVLERLRRSGKSANAAFKVNCADCNEPTILPFQPKDDRQAYCNPCWKRKQDEESKSTQEAANF